MRSGRLTWAGCIAGISLLAAMGAVSFWSSGCYEGLPPEAEIPETGDPPSYLPRDFQPGSTPEYGLLYYYDQSSYTEYKNEAGRNQIPAGTDPRYIQRGSVLSIIGATQAQIERPDTVDALLADVYANPRLFGFEPAADRAPGFYDGQFVENAEDFMPPCMSTGSCAESYWIYNHVENKWRRRSFLVGTTTSPTSQGGTTWIMRDSSRVRDSDRETHLPSQYGADVLWSVVPGRGIFQHGMTLTAERPEIVVEGSGSPGRQRNPTPLWLAQLQLGATDPQQVALTSLDQCLDAMWGDFDLYPLQLTGADLQVGHRYVTWTYVKTDSAEIRRRVTSGNEIEQLRCSGPGTPPPDVPVDSAAFPIYYFSLLARYEIAVERLYDVLEWKSGNTIVGEYGARDGIVDAVKLVVRMYVVAPDDRLAQSVDLYFMRDVGLVVQRTGLDVDDISRLREAQIDGVYYPPSAFNYVD